MKRFAKILVIVLVLTALLAVSAWAADFTHCADALKDMGLFAGTNKGYDLDRTPNRAEASTMLVRLLGKEAEAKSIEDYTMPFTDVPAWARPYVQYLYDNGLTKGTSATTFGADDPCTAQQYATFLLRVLGYSDAAGGDFTYANALDFAMEKGVADLVNCTSGKFLRDHMVAMSYTALATAPKSGEADLLTKLVKAGAVQNAKAYQDLFADFRAYSAASRSMSESTAMSTKAEMTMDMTLAGAPYLSGKIAMDIAAQIDPAHMDQAKMTGSMDMDMAFDESVVKAGLVPADQAKQKLSASYFYTGGCIYMDMAGAKLKQTMPLDQAMAQFPMSTDTVQSSSTPISAITALTKTGSAYRLTFAPQVLNGMVESVLQSVPGVGTDGLSMTYDAITAEVTIRGGRLQSLAMDMGVRASMEGQTMAMRAGMKLQDIQTGSAVRVTIPTDLSGYLDASGLIGGADGPTSVIVSAA